MNLLKHLGQKFQGEGQVFLSWTLIAIALLLAGVNLLVAKMNQGQILLDWHDLVFGLGVALVTTICLANLFCWLRMALWRLFRRKSTIRVFYAFILLALLWLIFGYYRPFEPHYHGQPLSRWADDFTVTEADESSDSPEFKARSKSSREAIQHIGGRALPLALELCRANDSEVKRKLVGWSDDWSEKLHFDIHIRSDAEKRAEAVEVFSALGAAAKPAIPSLIEILKGSNQFIYGSAMQSLNGIGSDAIPSLLNLLESGNRQERLNAATCLEGYSGRTATNAVPAFLSCLTDADYRLRKVAAESLWQFHADPRVIPALVKFFENETNKPAISYHVFFCLQHLGTNARPFIPFLVKQAKAKPRSAAYETLYELAPEIAPPIFAEWKATNLDFLPSQTNAPATTNAPASP
jgi:hypothetical protein